MSDHDLITTTFVMKCTKIVVSLEQHQKLFLGNSRIQLKMSTFFSDGIVFFPKLILTRLRVLSKAGNGNLGSEPCQLYSRGFLPPINLTTN